MTGDAPAHWHRVRRLLVVRADNIGDLVLMSPALRALRNELPHSRITLLASPAGSLVAPMLPWIDDVIRRRVLWQDLGRLAFDPDREQRFIALLRAQRFDGAIVFTSFSQSPHPAAFVAWLAGIPLRAGASNERSEYLTDAAPFGEFSRHQAERNLSLVRALGFRADREELELTVPARATVRTHQLLEQAGLQPGAPYLLLNPWASAAARTYSPELAADAAAQVAAATGFGVVITAEARRTDEARRLAARIGDRAVSVAGMTTVSMLAALVRGARLAITSHTSVMHLADAFATPVVVPFAGTDLISQWAPRRAPNVLLQRPVGCSPCYAFECPYAHECLTIPSGEIAEAALGLLNAAQTNTSRSSSGGPPRRRGTRSDAPYLSAGEAMDHA